MTGGTNPSGPRAAVAAAALEQLPSVIWAFSGPDHVAVLANRAGREYRGGSRRHLLGRSLRESLATENRPLVALLDEVYHTGRTITYYETEMHVDREERIVTFTAVPLRDDEGAVTGVLTHMIDVTDSVRARRRAERELASEHEVLLALQERLLPRGLPLLPGARVAARYRSAGEHLDAGGDWYDAVSLGGGCLGVSVGDVVGHGAGAAALMGQLRAALAAALLSVPDVAVALAQLTRFVAAVPAARGSTACVAVFDPAEGRLRCACAGHPPPVLLRADGSIELLVLPPSPPMGLPGAGPAAFEVRLGPGDAVLLYSDGAVERPGLPTKAGERRLLAACHEAWRGGSVATGELVDAVLAAVTADAPADDVALLVLARPLVAVPALRVDVPACAEQLARLRVRLRRWLAELEVAEEDALALQIACGEACANAVEHAFAGAAPGTVTLTARLTEEGEVRMRVTDTGRWQQPSPNPRGRGRGLLLMRQCTDAVEVRRDPEGTSVELVRRVHGSTLEQPEPKPGEEVGLGLSVETTADGVHATLVGDLDAASSPEAGRMLREASRGGALPLTVDASQLAHLASAGVLLLFELVAEAATAGGTFVVVTRRGSGAHHVLSLTGFPEVAELRVLDPVPAALRG